MKLRIKGNAIRMRLTKTEIAAVAEGQAVSESIALAGAAKFTYSFEPSNEVTELCARFENARIRVLAPVEEAKAWAVSNDVAIKNGSELSLLVEKDFQCLKPRMHEHEDESDLYYNPNEVHGHCR